MSILEPLLSFGQAVDHERVIAWVREFGAFILLLFSFGEVVPPISFLSPGGFVLIAAGAIIDTMEVALHFFLASWLGFLLGNSGFYWLGRQFGRDIAHRVYLSEKRLRSVDEFMMRFGHVSIFLGQFVGSVRPFIAFIAGTARAPAHIFFLSMAGGSALWTVLLLSAGFLLRDHLGWLLSGIGVLSSLLFIGLVIFVVRAERTLLEEKGNLQPNHRDLQGEK